MAAPRQRDLLQTDDTAGGDGALELCEDTLQTRSGCEIDGLAGGEMRGFSERGGEYIVRDDAGENGGREGLHGELLELG